MNAVEDLLFLSQRIPFPPDKGEKIRAFHILKALAERYRVHLGCFVDDPADAAHVAALDAYCASVRAIRLPRSTLLLRSLSALATGASVSESCFRDQRMTDWISKTVAEHGIGKAFVFCSSMARYAIDLPAKKILDIVDVDSEKWRAYAETASWPTRMVYARESRKVLSLERSAAMAYDRVLFVSAAEAALFSARVPQAAARVLAMNNGVDLDYFDPSQPFVSPFRESAKPIVFTGTMNYRPNVEAVTYFANDVLPAIQAAQPRAEFWIVGAQPSREVRALAANASIRVTGQVADVRPYLAHADCAVAPLRMARGVQNKVLEAFAMARPVVASPQACEGIGASPGKEILVAHDAQSFACHVSAVLKGEHAGLGARARARVETDYRWPQNLRVLLSLFSSPGAG
jgi:sugar transferase (PEP-CTERM/EpsH1 system associated)